MVTVSAGAVVGPVRRGAEPGERIELADRLLYEAKQAGRDRGFLLDLGRNAKRPLVF